jgi:hypothetical protein
MQTIPKLERRNRQPRCAESRSYGTAGYVVFAPGLQSPDHIARTLLAVTTALLDCSCISTFTEEP